MKARTLWNTFKYVLAFGLLAYVVYKNWDPGNGRGLKDVWQKYVVEGQPIHYLFLAAGFVTLLVSMLITLLRWYVLVRAQDLPFTIRGALSLGLVGFFFNTVMPGSVGGDIVKAAVLAREQSRRTVAVATVIMDRMIALWALVWFVALIGGASWLMGLLDGPSARPALVIVSTAAITVVVSLVVWSLMGLLPQWWAEGFGEWLESRLPRIGGSAAEFWRAIWMYRCRQWSVAKAMVLSWIGHVGFVLAFYCCTRTLWDEAADNPIPTLVQHFLIVPIGLVINAMPLFPGGAGIGEYAFGWLYELFGSAAANGILGSLVQRVLMWVIGLFGYLLYLRMRATVKAAQPTAAVEEKAALTVDKGLAWRNNQPHGVVAP